ncbi:MAG: universal stress protein [Actinomycetota bacterium]|nr:universal stress protein [Actinomycetota bacterium]
MSILPTKVLLATDGSEDAALATRTAVDLCNKTDSELHVVTVARVEYRPGYDIPESGDLLSEVYRSLEQEAQELLDEQVKKVEEAGGIVAESYLRSGRRDREIVALADEIDSGLIVMGSRGRGGVRRALMGSVSDSVVRHAHCPVLVVRGEGGEEERTAITFPTKILVATDSSEEATLAARTAADIAAKTESEVHLVHVRGMPVYIDPGSEAPRVASGAAEETIRREAQGVLDTQAEQLEAANGKVTQTHLRLGRPVEEIIVLADEIDAELVVMGSRGLGRVRRLLLGSVSDGVVRHAHCPVMVVRKEKR